MHCTERKNGQQYPNGKYIDIDYGYIYVVPPASSNLLTNISNYGKYGKETGKQEDTKYALPFAAYKVGTKTEYYDVNINAFKKDKSAKNLETMGTFPAVLHDKKKTNKVFSLNANGSLTLLTKNIHDEDVVLIAAPAGAFGDLKQLANPKLKDLNTATKTVYYGTMPLNISKGVIKINDFQTTLSSNLVAFCTYYGLYGQSVYCTFGEKSLIGFDIGNLQALEDSIEVLVNDPLGTIDWDKYKLHRLMENADGWSTILLIAILNILPRIAMFLFMILILLALIKDFKPWKMFNQRIFDVYKLLTFGHVSIDTINYKRVVFTSMMCLALFFMIMDGTLWNIILWCIKGILYLQQH